MAKASDHIQLANRNQEALAFLLEADSRFPEWVTTVAFYKAVHVVEAVFVANDLDASTEHKDRLRKLKSDRRFGKIYEHFRPLFNASLIARYLIDPEGRSKTYRTFSDYLPADKVSAEMVRHRLHQVEESAVKFLGADGPRLVRAVTPPAPPGPRA
ncbi:MAG: hypothetical protein ABL998_00600 [Planctomycetota bacterium]